MNSDWNATMLIYLIPIPFIIIGKLVSIRVHDKYTDANKTDLFLTFFPFLIMALIVGLRGSEVGVDTVNYLSDASSYQNYSYKDLFALSLGRGSLVINKVDMEIGYGVIAKYLYDTFHTTQAILLFMAIVTYFCFWISVNYLSDDPYLSTWLVLSTGFFTVSLNVARQLTVIGILSVIYIFILKKKWFPAILLLIFSLTLHQTVILGFLGIVFIRFIPIRRKNALLILGLNAAFVALIHPISVVFVHYFPKYVSFLSVKDKLATYGSVRFLWVIEIILTFYLLLYAFDHIEEKSLTLHDRHQFCCICFTYFYIGLNLCSQYVWLVNRIGFYFQIGTLFLFPMVLKKLRRNAPRFLYCLTSFGIYAFFFLWYYISINNMNKIAYSSPWLTL